MKFGVCFVREGYVEIEAPDKETAVIKANQLREEDVSWDDFWEAYDAYEIEDENPDKEGK